MADEEEQEVSGPPANEDIAKRIQQALQLRDKISEIKEKHDEELAPYKKLQEELHGLLMEALNRANVKSMSAPKIGVIMINERNSASLEDVEAFRSFVVNMGEWDLADLRANATRVQEYVTDNGSLPPGVKVSTFRTLGLRRANKK